jgi:DNA-directed RNA polymerase subunit RPC12/RpoP
MIFFKCQRCMSLMTARDDQVGEMLGCPHCGTRATVPAPIPVNLPAKAAQAAPPVQPAQGDPANASLPESAESADGSPIPALSDDFYLDDSPYTPNRQAGLGVVSLTISLMALSLVALYGLLQVTELLQKVLPLSNTASRVIGNLLPVVIVVMGATAVGLGVRGVTVRQPAALISVCLGIIAAAFGVVLFIYIQFPE